MTRHDLNHESARRSRKSFLATSIAAIAIAGTAASAAGPTLNLRGHSPDLRRSLAWRVPQPASLGLENVERRSYYGLDAVTIESRTFADIAREIGFRVLREVEDETYDEAEDFFPGRSRVFEQIRLRAADANLATVRVGRRDAYAIAFDIEIDASARQSGGYGWRSRSSAIETSFVVRIVAVPRLDRGDLEFEILDPKLLRSSARAFGEVYQRDAQDFLKLVADAACDEIVHAAEDALEVPRFLQRGDFNCAHLDGGDLVLIIGPRADDHIWVDQHDHRPGQGGGHGGHGGDHGHHDDHDHDDDHFDDDDFYDRPPVRPSRPRVITHEKDRPIGARKLNSRDGRLPRNTVVIFEDKGFKGDYEVLDIDGPRNIWQQIGGSLRSDASSVKFNLDPGVIVSFAEDEPDPRRGGARQLDDLGATFALFGSGAFDDLDDFEFNNKARSFRHHTTDNRGRNGAPNTITFFEERRFGGDAVTISIDPRKAGVLRQIPSKVLDDVSSIEWNLEKGVVVTLFDSSVGDGSTYTIFGAGKDDDTHADDFANAAASYAIYDLK